MKNISTFIITGIIAMALFLGTSVSAETPQLINAQTTLTVQEQIKSLTLQLIELLKMQILELQEQNKTKVITISAKKDVETDKVKYDPKKSDTYPKQTTKAVKTSAKTISVDGDLNDQVEFTLEFNLNAFGSRSYISENFDDSFDFSIIDGNGNVAYDSDGAQSGAVIGSFSSSADLDNSQYRIDEDTEESFEINLTYNPYGGAPAGSGSYKLQLDSVSYKTSLTGTLKSFDTSNKTKFRTYFVNIIN